MKGLFLKDMCYFKELLKTLAIFLVIATMMLFFDQFSYERLVFVFSYMVICGGMTSVNLIAYDQDQNGMSFLFTLPASRRDYVREKYLFSGFVVLVIFTVMAMLGFGAIFMQHVPVDWQDIGISAGAALTMASVMLSFMIPLKLKFEEKGNLIMVVTVFATVALVYFLSRSVKYLPINVEHIVAFFERYHVGIILGAVVIVIGGLLSSIKISERILEKKEY